MNHKLLRMALQRALKGSSDSKSMIKGGTDDLLERVQGKRALRKQFSKKDLTYTDPEYWEGARLSQAENYLTYRKRRNATKGATDMFADRNRAAGYSWRGRGDR